MVLLMYYLTLEIDKMSRQYNNAQHALLEVLDPSQHKEFIDNYLDIPYDLSDVDIPYLCS